MKFHYSLTIIITLALVLITTTTTAASYYTTVEHRQNKMFVKVEEYSSIEIMDRLNNPNLYPDFWYKTIVIKIKEENNCNVSKTMKDKSFLLECFVGPLQVSSMTTKGDYLDYPTIYLIKSYGIELFSKALTEKQVQTFDINFLDEGYCMDKYPCQETLTLQEPIQTDILCAESDYGGGCENESSGELVVSTQFNPSKCGEWTESVGGIGGETIRKSRHCPLNYECVVAGDKNTPGKCCPEGTTYNSNTGYCE